MTPRSIPPAQSISARSVWGVIGIGAIALSLYATGIGRTEWLNLNGWPQLWQFLSASVQPDLSPDFLRVVVNATFTTLAYAVCGTCLSLVIGAIAGLLLSEVAWLAVFPRWRGQRPMWLGLRLVLAVPRAIHELIWGLFFIHLLGLDPLVAVLAIAIPYGAIVAKVFAEILDETPRQPLMVLLNSGISPLPALLYGLFPTAALNLLSYAFYRFECSIRSAAVLGIIGAGGLGYEMLLSLQSLRYNQLWTLFLAMVILNGSVDVGSAWFRHRIGSPSRLDLNWRTRSRRPQRSQPARSPRSWDLGLAVSAIALLIPLCFYFIHPDISKLWSPRTARLWQDMAQSSWPPTWSSDELLQLLPLAGQTLAMSIVAIAFAGIGGILLSFPAARTLLAPQGLLYPTAQGRVHGMVAKAAFLLTRLGLLLARAIPAPIWALVALFVLFPGILPGAIALGIHNLGILGRLMAEVNEDLDHRPLLALKAQGAPTSSVLLYGVLPMTLTRFLAYILYRWEVCMRETVIVGLVGAGGLGRVLTEQLSSFDYRRVIVTLIGFVLLTFLVDWISQFARRALR